MQLTEIESRWRGLVNEIYSLQGEVALSLSRYEKLKLNSKSTTQEQLEDYSRMLADIIKVFDGD